MFLIYLIAKQFITSFYHNYLAVFNSENVDMFGFTEYDYRCFKTASASLRNLSELQDSVRRTKDLLLQMQEDTLNK